MRINVVDSLRGFAVVGIIIIHFLEHLNFYSFPEPTAFEQGLWDTVFYLGSNKMYAIFALLFGLSCYIQHHNQEVKGNDFRGRFAWRMLLLLGWGMVDLMFFNGDILCTYAVLGLFLIPLVKASNKVLVGVALLLFLQPIELAYLIAAVIDPSVSSMDLGMGALWGKAFDACANGSIIDVAKTNLECGLQINFGWALENGRLTQTLFLFIVGMFVGRTRLFIDEGNHMRIWKMVMVSSVIGYVVMQTLLLVLPFGDMHATIGKSAEIMVSSWRNFAMMAFYVSGITLLYYRTSVQKVINHLACIGKMSLTDYLLQSIIGGFIFYNWGLNLHTVSGHAMSFVLGIVFCICLYFFCRMWTSRFQRGPLEEIWRRLTWIGKK
ncbi:MAG: DUF418 domain-containing protein [Bacteroidia bacterium]|nr:DUF418 domain-containing protein [Bacteroidia bacterium]